MVRWGMVTCFIVEGRQQSNDSWVRLYLGATEPAPFSSRREAEDFAWSLLREYEDAGEALETRIIEVEA